MLRKLAWESSNNTFSLDGFKPFVCILQHAVLGFRALVDLVPKKTVPNDLAQHVVKASVVTIKEPYVNKAARWNCHRSAF